MTQATYIVFFLLLSVLPCPTLIADEFSCVLRNGDAALPPTLLSIDLEGFPFSSKEQNSTSAQASSDEHILSNARSLALFRIEGDKKVSLPCQVEQGCGPRLWFVQDREVGANETVIYELVSGGSRPIGDRHSVSTDADTTTLYHENARILSYRHSLHDVPEGVNPLFRRSGFIHPLWSPEGKVLTRIQPPDHYHHYGIWNPWTKTRINGQEVDFWNLGKGQGKVRFAKLLGTMSGDVFSGFTVKHDHVILKSGDVVTDERIAIHEIWDVRAAGIPIDDQVTWFIDFTIHLCNALENPIELCAYRYGGGLGFRATDAWVKENCRVLTSEGKTRKDADNTGARWCDVRGGEAKTAGIVFMSHEENQGHPEPMRIWPEDSVGGKGYFFFGFTPTRHEPWILEPQKEYRLSYRMCVYDGAMEPALAERLWKAFVAPPRIEVKR